MKRIYFLLFAMIAMFIITSCNKDEQVQPSGKNSKTGSFPMRIGESEIMVCGTSTYTLWAGQTINAGTLNVSNDGTNLYVTYTTTGVFGTLHLWVGSDLSLMPKNSQGTPIPGKFPYVFDASGLTTYTYTIPLANIPFYTSCGSTLYVVAHAEVTINGNNETAFGGDTAGTGTSRWFFYAAYQTACCENPPTPTYEKLGTAFAKGGYVFTTDRKSNPENLPSLNLTKNRWGWAINIPNAGSQSYQLWVGAGLNYTSKGTRVGTVSVDYTGTQVIVTYNLYKNYFIEEAHIYAGDFRPTTLAPGQYGNTAYFNPLTDSYSAFIDVTDTDGDGIWLIVHAVAYGPGVVNL